MKLRRSIARWRGMEPATVVNGSDAQCQFCIDDAKHDILSLWQLNDDLLKALAFYRDGFDMEYRPREALLDDCGNTAMSALKLADQGSDGHEGISQ